MKLLSGLIFLPQILATGTALMQELLQTKCKALINKPGIQLIVTHDFMDNKTMLDFLAQNTH